MLKSYKMTTFIATVLCLILFLCKASAQLVGEATTASTEANVEPSKSIVALKRLPEMFSNDRLPPQLETEQDSFADKCLHLLGCIRRIPDTPVTEQMVDPTKMKTLFEISTRKSKVLVPYQPMLNCLSHSPSTCDNYPFNLNLLVEANFNPKLRTIIYIGGYRSDFDDYMLDFRDSWLAWEEVNFVMLSWSGGNKGVYKSAVANTRVLARQVTVLLYYLGYLKLGQNDVLTNERYTRRLNFVGHSLGAHTAGFVGATLGGRVGRITGLDPAGPMFIDKLNEDRLDRSDGGLVDVLHTNGGQISLMKPTFFGLFQAVGHLDYYANDGQHQPNCFSDGLGCSHKTAVDFYQSFLQHEVYMRRHLENLDQNYHSCHRFFAYASDSYEQFLNGSSLVERCPKSMLDDADLYSSDINHCLVPIDFVSPYEELKEKLSSQYNLDFDTSPPKSNIFFFSTHQKTPYLNNHQLIRARVSASNVNQEECDIQLEIKMAGGAKLERKVDRFRLMGDPNNGYLEVMVPFLSPNLMSKYELAELDAHDYFQDQLDKLKDKLGKVFPSSIRLSGSLVGGKAETGKNKPKGLAGLFQSFFGSGNENEPEDEFPGAGCNLNIESISVQPMKKIHRNLVAVYSLGGYKKSQLDLEFLLSENSTLPKLAPLRGKREVEGKQQISELYLDAVYLGPFDPDLDTGPTFDPNLSDDELLGGEALVIDVEKAVKETSSRVEGRFWVALMVVSLLMVVALVSYVLRALEWVQKGVKDDRLRLVETVGETN